MFIDDLKIAKRPAILVGGGAYSARSFIHEASHMHGIPVFRTWNAMDIATDGWSTYCGTVGTYGGPGRNFGIQNCDLLLTLGCRISGRITGGMPETFARAAIKYVVDIEQGHDALAFMRGAFKYQNGGEVLLNKNDWLTQCREWLKKYDPVKPEMLTSNDLHHYGFMRRLSELLPASAIVVYDTGGSSIMMGHCFRSKTGQRIFSSNGNSPMGFAMCAAIGAWFADPSRPIVCIIGDGGMCINIQEIQTLANYGIPIKVFILNNHILGNTKSFQRVNGMKEVACGPDGYKPPDFGEVVKAFGLFSYHIPHTAGMDGIIEQVMASDKPAICDVVHDDYCTYEPRISRWDCPIEDAYPFLPRDEFRANMIIEPWVGWEKNA